MFCRQLNRRFDALFTGYREKGKFTAEDAVKLAGDCKRVRGKDYIFSFDVSPGSSVEHTVTTTANWFFILTNAAVYFDSVDPDEFPRVEFDFIDSVVKSPFSENIEYPDGVPTGAVFAYEGKNRFQEYKNLFYVLGDRVNISVRCIPTVSKYSHGYVLLNGLELDLSEA